MTTGSMLPDEIVEAGFVMMPGKTMHAPASMNKDAGAFCLSLQMDKTVIRSTKGKKCGKLPVHCAVQIVIRQPQKTRLRDRFHVIKKYTVPAQVRVDGAAPGCHQRRDIRSRLLRGVTRP